MSSTSSAKHQGPRSTGTNQQQFGPVRTKGNGTRGENVGLKWIPDGEGTWYLGVQVGSHLPPEANFEKMRLCLKNKLISWSNNRLSLAGRILVANQVLLASMWYIAASWNPNPRMCSQIRGIVRNFIWGGRDAPTRAKVKWDTMVMPTS